MTLSMTVDPFQPNRQLAVKSHLDEHEAVLGWLDGQRRWREGLPARLPAAVIA